STLNVGRPCVVSASAATSAVADADRRQYVTDVAYDLDRSKFDRFRLGMVREHALRTALHQQRAPAGAARPEDVLDVHVADVHDALGRNGGALEGARG